MKRYAVLASTVVVAFALTLRIAAQNPPASQTSSPPQPQNGAITGTVVDGASGEALDDVVLTLGPLAGSKLPPEYPTRQLSDERGRFVFLNVPDGTFQITAAKFGYLDGGYGRDSGPIDTLRPIGVTGGSWASGLKVPIWLPSTISGTVRDESGEPVVGVIVRTLARIRVAGHDELAGVAMTMTDDLGRYRLSGMLAGRYIVQVPSVQAGVRAATLIPAANSNAPEGAIDIDDTSRLVIGRFPLPPPSVDGRAMTYGPAFHPNVTVVAQAATVDVSYGESRPGIDVVLTPVPAVRVSGVLDGPAEAFTTMTVRLLPVGMENLGNGSEVATSPVSADGAFTFVNVPAGSYVIDAPLTVNQLVLRTGASSGGGFVGSGGSVTFPPPPARRGGVSSLGQQTALPGVSLSSTDYRGASNDAVPKFSGRGAVTVGAADVNGVVVKLRPMVTIRGSVRAEIDSAKPAPTPLRVYPFLDPANGLPVLGIPFAPSVTVDQEFEISGIVPGDYFLRCRTFDGLQVKSVTWQGRDFSSVPLDLSSGDASGITVTVTNNLPTIAGTVHEQDRSVPESAQVVVFPVQPSQRLSTGLMSPLMSINPMRSDGTFRVTSLPAGEYYVAAIDRSRSSTWRTPEVLAQIERQAARINLAWGQTVTQDLTLAVIR